MCEMNELVAVMQLILTAPGNQASVDKFVHLVKLGALILHEP